jgi:hypothetical protein
MPALLLPLMELYFEHALVGWWLRSLPAHDVQLSCRWCSISLCKLMSLLCSSLTFCTHGHRHEFQPPSVPLTDGSNLQSFHRVTLQRLSRSVR